jgi:hypothetical protein
MADSEQIRHAVEQIDGQGKRRCYGRELRDRIVAYTVERRRAGAELDTIGAELNVPWRTLARWCVAARKHTRSFRRVDVVAETPALVTVHGPHGIRIEGLGMDAIADLIRRLG